MNFGDPYVTLLFIDYYSSTFNWAFISPLTLPALLGNSNNSDLHFTAFTCVIGFSISDSSHWSINQIVSSIKTCFLSLFSSSDGRCLTFSINSVSFSTDTAWSAECFQQFPSLFWIYNSCGFMILIYCWIYCLLWPGSSGCRGAGSTSGRV